MARRHAAEAHLFGYDIYNLRIRWLSFAGSAATKREFSAGLYDVHVHIHTSTARAHTHTHTHIWQKVSAVPALSSTDSRAINVWHPVDLVGVHLRTIVARGEEKEGRRRGEEKGGEREGGKVRGKAVCMDAWMYGCMDV